MKLFLIRHGESANNRLDDTVTDYDDYMSKRCADPPLTELGERQAEAVAHHVATAQIPEHHRHDLELGSVGYGITKLYCSGMLRAMQTTQPIARALGLQPTVWVDIHEHGGMFEGNPRSEAGVTNYAGMTRTAMQDRFPGYILPAEITEAGWWHGGYEAMSGCNRRAAETAETLRTWAKADLEEARNEHVALVVHGTFMDAVIKALTGQLPNEKIYYSHYNTAITRVDFLRDELAVLRYVNRSRHLSGELLTASPASV